MKTEFWPEWDEEIELAKKERIASTKQRSCGSDHGVDCGCQNLQWKEEERRSERQKYKYKV